MVIVMGQPLSKYFLCLLLLPLIGLGQTTVIDSLKAALNTAKQDTNKVSILATLGDKLWRIGIWDSSMICADEALAISEKVGFQRGIANSLHLKALLNWQKGNYPTSLSLNFRALKIRESIRDERGIAISYNSIGNVYWNQENFNEALTYHKKALAIREKLGDKAGQAGSYNNIGIISIEKGDYPSALNYFIKSVEIRRDIGDRSGMATALNNIGIVFENNNNLDSAYHYFKLSLEIRKEIGDRNGCANSLSSIGNLMFLKGKFAEARKYEAEGYNIALQLGNKRHIITGLVRLAKIDSAEGNFKAAFEKQKLQSVYRDSLVNEANTKKSVEAAMNYEFEKKETAAKAEQDKKDAVAAAEKQRQKIITWSIVGILLLVAAFAIFAYRSYLQKQKANKELDEKNKAISEQKKLVEEKNILITDSIEYAKSIQDAILPSKSLLNEWLSSPGGGGAAGDGGGWFVFFKPKDVVSGDFYWAKPVRNKIFVAVIDCTGHGVPGAFMSLMAFNMLQNIIIKKEFSQPSLILDELNKQVLSILNQQTENASAKYGMDITLIEIDRAKGKVEFAGAHNPLLIVSARENVSPVGEMPKAEGGLVVRSNSLLEIKADKTTIGMAREPFANNTIKVKKGDMLYMFTDGYPDQKGGPQNKKFFASTFRELLISLSGNECAVQSNELERTFNDWKAGREQTDDVLVMGIRI